MADYRYFLADALTGVIIEELPLTVQSYSQQLNGAGQATATLPVADGSTPSLWRSATIPRRTLLMVQRGDNYTNPVWGGMVMKRRPVGDGHTQAEITAETLEGYWGRRKIKADLVEAGVDLFQVVRDIIAQLQAVTGGNMRMLVSSGSAGATTTVTYLGKDRAAALDAINRLAEVSSFEYAITWSRSGNVFTPTLQLAAPALNTTADALLLEHPGSLATPVDEPEDGTQTVNALTGVGADSGGTPLLAEVVDTAGEIAAGYPIFEDEWSAKDETDYSRLATRTTAQLNARLADKAIATVELSPPSGQPGDITVGDLALGQPVRLRCTCPYHPAGVNGVPGLDTSTRRITGWTVAPGLTDRVTLTLGSSTGLILPPRLRRDTNAYLADLARRVRTLETM